MSQAKWIDMDSRSRDALVAEKVMGWKRHVIVERDSDWQCSECACKWWKPAWRVDELVQFHCGGDTRNKDALEFTTDISAAFQVVDKMCEEGFVFRLSSPRALTGMIWETVFYVEEGEAFFGQAATKEEAICKASLRAKGVEV